MLVTDSYAEAFLEQAKKEPPPLAKAEGDGVLVCGGGRYWSGVVTCVKMLRRVSNLPVQIWHRADERTWPSDLKNYSGITYHNASTYPHRRLLTTEIKALAAVHCDLERFLLLDADAYPVVNPKVLLDLADPIAFWSNHEVCALAENCDWSGYGWMNPVDRLPPPVQSGHYIVNRRNAWKFLNFNHWANDHSDWYYPLGVGNDQHVFRACLAELGTSYTDLGRVSWIPPAVVCLHNNRPAIVHLTGCKMLVEKIGHLPGGNAFMDLLADFLRGSWV